MTDKITLTMKSGAIVVFYAQRDTIKWGETGGVLQSLKYTHSEVPRQPHLHFVCLSDVAAMVIEEIDGAE